MLPRKVVAKKIPAGVARKAISVPAVFVSAPPTPKPTIAPTVKPRMMIAPTLAAVAPPAAKPRITPGVARAAVNSPLVQQVLAEGTPQAPVPIANVMRKVLQNDSAGSGSNNDRQSDNSGVQQQYNDSSQSQQQDTAPYDDVRDYGTPAAPSDSARDGQARDEREESQAEPDLAPLFPDGVEPPAQDWETDINWQEMQGFAGEELQLFAHVSKGKMCMSGVCKTPFGIFPVVKTLPVHPMAPSGPVVAGESLSMLLNQPIAEGSQMLQIEAGERALKLAAESLVKRARAGDQNAMGLINMVGKNAKRGIPRAVLSAKAIEEYIRSHPVDSPFGSDAPTVMHEVTTMLANSAPLSTARIEGFSSTFGTDDEEELFRYAIHNHHDRNLVDEVPDDWGKKIAQFGQAVGRARAIQIARLPRSPLGVLGPDVGWEFGE